LLKSGQNLSQDGVQIAKTAIIKSTIRVYSSNHRFRGREIGEFRGRKNIPGEVRVLPRARKGGKRTKSGDPAHTFGLSPTLTNVCQIFIVQAVEEKHGGSRLLHLIFFLTGHRPRRRRLTRRRSCAAAPLGLGLRVQGLGPRDHHGHGPGQEGQDERRGPQPQSRPRH
jgi:hypothetical protein